MEKTPLLIIAGKNENRAEDLSIQVEPSVPMLTSLTRLFRSQGQFQQAADLCRLGVEYYPHQPEVRLLSALCQLDLGNRGASRAELEFLAGELRPLSSGLSEWGTLARRLDLEDLAEWCLLLAQVLDRFPDQPKASAAAQARGDQPPADSQVVPTLKKWLSQLQNPEPS